MLGIELNLEEASGCTNWKRPKEAFKGNIGKVWFNEAKREVDKFVDLWGEQLKGQKSGSSIRRGCGRGPLARRTGTFCG